MLYAVVPVKTLIRAKTRLAPALSMTERLLLARRFLRDTLEILAQHPGAPRTIIVSADAQALQLARRKGMIALAQTARGGINRAVDIGCDLARRRGATAILVLPTDLPLLTALSLRRFTQHASTPVIRLAADRHGSGTNALYAQPPVRDFARFGAGSLNRHRAAGNALGMKVEVIRQCVIAFDVDTPADLPIPMQAQRNCVRTAGYDRRLPCDPAADGRHAHTRP
jgi:2-phospho-L-lactate guanylyltransferase